MAQEIDGVKNRTGFYVIIRKDFSYAIANQRNCACPLEACRAGQVRHVSLCLQGVVALLCPGKSAESIDGATRADVEK